MADKLKLKHIVMFDYPNCDYTCTKNIHIRSFNQYLKEGCTIAQCVYGHYYYFMDFMMEENGMDKFVAMLVGMLFMIQQNEVDADHAYNTKLDIQDFETGDYDDLFTEKDLSLIRADVEVVKAYLSQHPELIID